MSILEYIVLIIIAFIPSIFWVWFFIRYDWKRPEPPLMIIKIFIWGMLIGFPIVFLERSGVFYFFSSFRNDQILFIILKAFFVTALIEETFKFFVVKLKAYNNPAFDEPLDGIVYCITAALGLAAFENSAAILIEGVTAVFSRFATTTLMHALAAGIMGYFMARAKFISRQEKPVLLLGLFLAILFHGLYNVIANFHSLIAIIFLVILLIIMYLLIIRLIKKTRKIHWKKSI